MSFHTITTAAVGQVAHITLNRPDRLNVASRLLCEELLRAVEQAAAAERIQVLLISGAGERAFCAGYDVAELSQIQTAEAAMGLAETVHSLFLSLETCPKPVVCAVRGWTLGFGFALLLAADCAIASRDALFGLPEIAFGVPPAWSLLRGMDVAGRHVLSYLALTTRHMDALTARRVGLVSEVVPPEELRDRALVLSRQLSKGEPFAQDLIKRRLNRACAEDAFRATGQTAVFLMSQDCKAAAERFLAQRGRSANP